MDLQNENMQLLSRFFWGVPKAWGWLWGWQMPELWAMQNLLMRHPQD